MTSYIIRRLLWIIPTIFGALSFLFVIFFTLPGDPATLIASCGQNKVVDPGVLERVEERYGLNDPVPTQFVNYWKNVLRWDLGESYQNDRSVNEILGERAPRSIRLAFWAILIEIVIGISVGLISAGRRYSLMDKMTAIGTAALAAIPVFVLGFYLKYAVAILPGPNYWNWPEWARLNTQGRGDDTWFLYFIPTGDTWRHLVLPAITLACVSTALAARMMRGSMLEVMGADYMRTARAKGLKDRNVIMRHGLRNAMLPVITLIAIDFGATIGAAVLTETVFAWQGLGWTIADSVNDRDLPVLLGLTLVVVLAYTFINLVVDISYAWFDPRVRLGSDTK